MDSKTFKIKVVPMSGKLLRFAVRFLRDDEQARDVVQEVFMKLWSRRTELAGVDNIEAYAMRMTRNLCIDEIQKHRSISLEQMKTRNEWISDMKQADEVAEHKDSARLAKEIIDQLPEQQRAVIHLRDIEHYELNEIARVLDMQNSAVRANLSRARKKVRDEMIKRINHGNPKSRNITGKVL
ncbi:RNA polymerase sigma factor [Prolixibacter denitrificans]|uniref:DNA-directed RNA polymerase sigma-70 factor n=2 Tax=Prolixibacter denitrificans TaxID=1541063 RepID=A0ABQ0ZFD3_9BACT|nr:sigma-70 family RNA polymerase sigma factor [Prolixibacter denitrificans]GET20146.1 DNA-directed RNA polymerase sigma-70 factor [Prolixibacter denitrificans]